MSATDTTAVATAQQRAAAEQFLYYEARLMDEHRYEEWEALWTEDGTYWVPAFHEDYDPDERVSLIYDTRAGIAARVRRLAGEHAYAQQPRARLLRVVSNVEAYDAGNGVLRTYANFMLSVERRGRATVWGGRSQHTLLIADDDPTGGPWDAWRIAHKTVRLVPLEAPLENLSFLL